jgi:hypothetical protein
MKNVLLISLLLTISLCLSCEPDQIQMKVSGIAEASYDALGIENDGSLGDTGQGYAIFINLDSPVSSNNTYQVGVQTDNGIIWSSPIMGIKQQVPNDKYHSNPGQFFTSISIIVPSDGFTSEIKAIQQEREKWINQVVKLEEQLQEMAYRNLTEVRWADYDKEKADVAKAGKIQSQIDELNDKINLYYEPELLVPYIKLQLKHITK